MYTPKGSFGWYELMTSDTAAAEAFYTSVVGWTTKNVGSPEMPYITFNIGEAGVAGMLSMPHHTAWVGYISVPDVDAHIEKVVEAGGKLWRPATDVPGMLRFAVMADPQGAPIVLFTSDPNMATPANPPVPPTPGTIGWRELYTTDVDAAWEFYSTRFGWTKVRDMDMGADGVYRIFDEGKGNPMGDGGMMKKSEHIPTSTWGYYILVDGIDAAIERVTAGGGKVVMGPHQVPGDQWIIQGVDPLGASFALVSNTK